MEKIYSRDLKIIKPLHIVSRKEDITSTRQDLVHVEEIIQVAHMSLSKNQKFRAHKHLIQYDPPEMETQETWIVIQGKVKAYLYDIDGVLLKDTILYPGDCSITLRGGHNYEVLDDNTLIYECKTGPYLGQERDRIFLKHEQ